MPAITLYQFPGERGLSYSPACNKVHWALRLKGLLYRTESVLSPRAARARRALPLLAYDGERVEGERAAILLLDARHPDPALIPMERVRAAEARALEAFGDEALAPLALQYRARERTFKRGFAQLAMPALAPGLARVFAAIPRRRLFAPVATPARGRDATATRERFETHLDVLESLLAERAWLLGTDAPTIADLGVASALHALAQPTELEAFAWVRARPAVSAWFERFLARASRVALAGDAGA